MFVLTIYDHNELLSVIFLLWWCCIGSPTHRCMHQTSHWSSIPRYMFTKHQMYSDWLRLCCVALRFCFQCRLGKANNSHYILFTQHSKLLLTHGTLFKNITLYLTLLCVSFNLKACWNYSALLNSQDGHVSYSNEQF